MVPMFRRNLSSFFIPQQIWAKGPSPELMPIKHMRRLGHDCALRLVDTSSSQRFRLPAAVFSVFSNIAQISIELSRIDNLIFPARVLPRSLCGAILPPAPKLNCSRAARSGSAAATLGRRLVIATAVPLFLSIRTVYQLSAMDGSTQSQNGFGGLFIFVSCFGFTCFRNTTNQNDRRYLAKTHFGNPAL